MSFSAGVFSINTAGQPVVTGTTISSTAFNSLTSDLATGLSTCLLKDGTQVATAAIPFAGGITIPTGYAITGTGTATIVGFANVFSETYTPTMTAVTNVDTITTELAQYFRVGNVVTVSGTFNLNATASNTATEFAISLPVASDFATSLQCGGSAAAAGFIENFAIFSDATNNRVTVQGICGNTSAAHTCSYSFTYLVVA